MSQFLNAIEKCRHPDMTGQAKIQHNEDSWKKKRLLCPRKSAYGKWLFPGQKVWQYIHYELCIKHSNSPFKPSSLCRRWFYLYLTDEEYIMAKMEF